jgi:transcriptional regulator with XRE-family HTH domain
MTTTAVGGLLREWRQRRRVSQLVLSADAGISTRHLSFVESGRSRPSRQMVLRLAEQLDVPLRERNSLLLAAGYAPLYRKTALDAPDMEPVRDAIDKVLSAHEPYPAVVVDHAWTLLAANASVSLFTEGLPPHLLEPPVNALRLTLDPDGLAPRIRNFGEWSAHLLARLHRQATVSGDPELERLYEELAALPGVTIEHHDEPAGRVYVPLQIRASGTELSFFSTIATFGTALDITLAELAIESFFPADRKTQDALRVLSRP